MSIDINKPTIANIRVKSILSGDNDEKSYTFGIKAQMMVSMI